MGWEDTSAPFSLCYKKEGTALSHLMQCVGVSDIIEAIFVDDVDKPIHPNMVYFGINKDNRPLPGIWDLMLHHTLRGKS